MRKLLLVFTVLLFVYNGKLQAQIASFNFSAEALTVSGWTNLAGDPSSGVRTATDPSGIAISSVSTSNWSKTTGGLCAFNGNGAYPGVYFPVGVMSATWLQYNGSSNNLALYNVMAPQLELTGLNKDNSYILRMSGSDIFSSDPTVYTVVGATVSGSQSLNVGQNKTQGITFQGVYPDINGKIRVYVNATSTTSLAFICGLQVFSGSANVGTPVVTLAAPVNGSVLAEGGNFNLQATASETGGTITRVVFYADTSKIGEVANAPYTLTWTNPAPGSYRITAQAIDNVGTINTSSVNVVVESLNYFWSTTGNIATGGDTSFVGTVDTNRLAFRTNNVERMSMSKDGNVTIGGKDTASHPAFRVYPNGDFVAGTTMDRSVDTKDQVGMRYYSKNGILQIGASDRLDSTVKTIAYGPWPTSGLIINTDEPNNIKGRIMNTVVAATTTDMDSAWRTENSFIGTENSHFTGGPDNTLIRSFVGGFGNTFSGPTIDASVITGMGMDISKTLSCSNISGFEHSTKDSVNVSLVSGVGNQFGGMAQFVSGMNLINKTRAGAVMGSGNVDFATLPYTGWGNLPVANTDQYPLLAIGNAYAQNTVRSNALTVLYNGRTQINTTGFTNQLTQANVTPAAALDVVSTNSGVLLPRLTNAQRNAIVAGDLKNGLLLYNTDSSLFQYYNGSVWNSVGSGGSSSGSNSRWLFNGTANTVYDSAESVAIGTNDAKGYKLAVKGTALFTRVQVVAGGNWPDYVFRKEYRLRKLEDLAGYIDKYHHLPEIVSAAKVGKEGFDLGANQTAILKKVEELTLYLINENRRLSSQNNQLEEQNKKLMEQGKQLQQQQREIDELRELIKKK